MALLACYRFTICSIRRTFCQRDTASQSPLCIDTDSALVEVSLGYCQRLLYHAQSAESTAVPDLIVSLNIFSAAPPILRSYPAVGTIVSYAALHRTVRGEKSEVAQRVYLIETKLG